MRVPEWPGNSDSGVGGIYHLWTDFIITNCEVPPSYIGKSYERRDDTEDTYVLVPKVGDTYTADAHEYRYVNISGITDHGTLINSIDYGKEIKNNILYTDIGRPSNTEDILYAHIRRILWDSINENYIWCDFMDPLTIPSTDETSYIIAPEHAYLCKPIVEVDRITEVDDGFEYLTFLSTGLVATGNNIEYTSWVITDENSENILSERITDIDEPLKVKVSDLSPYETVKVYATQIDSMDIASMTSKKLVNIHTLPSRVSTHDIKSLVPYTSKTFGIDIGNGPNPTRYKLTTMDGTILNEGDVDSSGPMLPIIDGRYFTPGDTLKLILERVNSGDVVKKAILILEVDTDVLLDSIGQSSTGRQNTLATDIPTVVASGLHRHLCIYDDNYYDKILKPVLISNNDKVIERYHRRFGDYMLDITIAPNSAPNSNTSVLTYKMSTYGLAPKEISNNTFVYPDSVAPRISSIYMLNTTRQLKFLTMIKVKVTLDDGVTVIWLDRIVEITLKPGDYGTGEFTVKNSEDKVIDSDLTLQKKDDPSSQPSLIINEGMVKDFDNLADDNARTVNYMNAVLVPISQNRVMLFGGANSKIYVWNKISNKWVIHGESIGGFVPGTAGKAPELHTHILDNGDVIILKKNINVSLHYVSVDYNTGMAEKVTIRENDVPQSTLEYTFLDRDKRLHVKYDNLDLFIIQNEY